VIILGIRTIVICDFCDKEMNQTEKSGWIEYDGESIFLFKDTEKICISGKAKLFCSVTCLASWLTKKIESITTKNANTTLKES
jgi:hypothetical protein